MISVAVFCGSRLGANKMYSEHARQIGEMIAARSMKLVYGGGNNGLMGIVANEVIRNGGIVKGIIPEILMEKEMHNKNIADLLVVADMHIRKKMMYDACNVVFVLPGGLGTLDELFEVLTWNALSIHNKPIFLLNSDGYFGYLIQHLDQMQQQGFLYENWKDSLVIANTPDSVFHLVDLNKY